MLLPRNLFKLQMRIFHYNSQRQVNFLSVVGNFRQRSLHTTQAPLMAGHSKWANIRHIKAEKDGQRAALFTRIARQIRLAVQDGGSPDPNMNSQLRSVVEQALRQNMPMSTVQSAIKKCSQAKTDLKRYLVELRYKQKVFLIVIVYTDNFLHSKMEMAPINKKCGAVATEVSHLFEEFGFIAATVDVAGGFLEEVATEVAIECGAEEVEVIDEQTGLVHFICRPIDLNTIGRAIESKGYKVDTMEHVYAAKNLVKLSAEELDAYEKFTERLRNLTGVEDIYDNIQLEESPS